MKVIKWGANELKMYTSIQDLTSYRFHVYNLNLLIDIGIGSDVAAVQRRNNNFLVKCDHNLQEAKQEIINQNQTIEFIVSNTSPKMRCFCAFIHTINGRVITNEDLTESGIDDLVATLHRKSVKWGIISDFVEFVKKKVGLEYSQFFPKRAGSGKDRTYYAYLKEHTLIRCKDLGETNPDLQKRRDAIDRYFAFSFITHVFAGVKGMEVQLIQAYSHTCNMIVNSSFSVSPRSMGVIPYFQALDAIKKANK